MKTPQLILFCTRDLKDRGTGPGLMIDGSCRALWPEMDPHFFSEPQLCVLTASLVQPNRPGPCPIDKTLLKIAYFILVQVEFHYIPFVPFFRPCSVTLACRVIIL